MEEKKSNRGGKREGAGRPRQENSKKQLAMKLDKDLYDVFYSSEFLNAVENRGRYINAAIRSAMIRDGYISNEATRATDA
ncbi:MAG: hypothetical protein J6A02_11765 [Prevotella sp.]|nr:hypothetical protein [Prevotella sp.]